MKLKSTPKKSCYAFLIAVITFLVPFSAAAQTLCSDPNTYIYGLTGNGEVYEINMTNAVVTSTPIKNNSYSGNSPNRANALAFNYANGKLYYFKRNVTASPQEFVSYDPSTNTVALLASSTLTDETHAGCANATGTGYYTFDIQGTFHFYNILTNSWTFITSTLVDQYGNDVDAVIRSQNAGDMAMDGNGNLWLLTSSNGSYGLYKLPTPLPTTPQASLTVQRIVSPSTSTPTGQSFAGIAFNPSGLIYMSTKSGNKLYRMNADMSLSFVGNMNVSDVGNDLTSCSYPLSALPVIWNSFDVAVVKSNQVSIDWEVFEDKNKGFYVQHSLDGSKWEDITYVAGKNDPQQASRYSYLHINNMNGKQYYRIKQVDIDGRYSYSVIKSVSLTKENKTALVIWPNPVHNQIRIINDNSANLLTQAQVFDLAGRMTAHTKLQNGINTIDISALSPGTYLVKAQSANGTYYNEKIIKQ